MIYDAVVCREQGGLVRLRERRSFVDTTFRFLGGSVPMFAGCLTTFTFLSGGGPTPIGELGQYIAGCVIIAGFFLVLGIFPLCWGLSLWFVRRSYTFRPGDGVLEARVAFAGLPVWTSRYALAAFERIAVRQELHGVFGKVLQSIVAFNGKQRLDLSSYAHRTTAEAFATDIGTQLNLPVL